MGGLVAHKTNPKMTKNAWALWTSSSISTRGGERGFAGGFFDFGETLEKIRTNLRKSSFAERRKKTREKISDLEIQTMDDASMEVSFARFSREKLGLVRLKRERETRRREPLIGTGEGTKARRRAR